MQQNQVEEITYESLIENFENAYYKTTVFYKDFVTVETAYHGDRLVELLRDTPEEVRSGTAEWVASKVWGNRPQTDVYLYSLAANLFPGGGYVEPLLDCILANKEAFSKNTLYFLAYQIYTFVFRNYSAGSVQIKIKLWKLFRTAFDLFKSEVNVSLEQIPMEQRNKDFIIVLTEQMLSTEHGPTKTTLDRCKTIMTTMGKKVLLICTNEVETLTGQIPFCCTRLGHGGYFAEKEIIEWKGVEVPYHEIACPMPDINVINEYLEMIRSLAPERIVCIGGGGVLIQLADCIVPCVDIGLAPSDLETTCVSYQTLGRKIGEQEQIVLKELGIPLEHVIESVFTFSLKTQESIVTRAELGIPENAYVIVTVGGRLDDEILDEFLEMLDSVWQDDFFMLFLGRFEDADRRLERFPKIKNACKVKMVEDILAVMENCDLYVNPIRRGGGTSCVEALYKGLPVVTTPYGDVPTTTGEAFWVRDYEEMKSQIVRYHEDEEFYKEQSKQALERVKRLLDTDGEFVRILEEVDRREKQNEERG